MILLSDRLQPHGVVPPSHRCSKQAVHCYSWHSVDGNAADVFMQPLTSQRGGHCLLHTEITLPYQLSAEMKCLMFVRCRKVVAVNQDCSESCSNLFFTNLPSQHTDRGAVTTGSSTRAGDSCSSAAFLCVQKDQAGEETAASGLAGSSTTKTRLGLTFSGAHVVLNHSSVPLRAGGALTTRSQDMVVPESP